MNTPTDRRRLLRLLFALGASAVVNQKLAFGESGACAAPAMEQLELSAVRELGREYLGQRPAESASVEAIAKLLAEPRSETETLAQLRARMRADFAAGRVVNLAGWFVSETEGCVFAVLSRCDGQL